MLARRISVSEELFWQLEKMRVENRLDSIEDLIRNLIGISPSRGSQTPVIKMKQKGSQQVLDVIEEMMKGNKFGDACKNIARKYEVIEATIREACTRRLSINTEEFENIINSPDRRDNLINKLKS